jgi:hypothetical protein
MLSPPATSISRRVTPSHNFFGEPRTVNIAAVFATREDQIILSGEGCLGQAKCTVDAISFRRQWHLADDTEAHGDVPQGRFEELTVRRAGHLRRVQEAAVAASKRL